ncbi:MAG: hypothetical protein CL610_15085 [Anaerolineaceae bacterium]|nr:hypothetical protein [Anaerolineaceae bacterium]
MLALDHPMLVATSKDCQPLLKLFGGDDGLPLTAHRLGWDACLIADHPTGVKPVVEDAGQRILVRLAPAIWLDLHKWTPASIGVTSPVEILADFLQCHPIFEQQVPG